MKCRKISLVFDNYISWLNLPVSIHITLKSLRCKNFMNDVIIGKDLIILSVCASPRRQIKSNENLNYKQDLNYSDNNESLRFVHENAINKSFDQLNNIECEMNVININNETGEDSFNSSKSSINRKRKSSEELVSPN
ncbi:hypothetical protein BpHYR1_043534 [Brachionus plicatilis]|uniref:Uncharacterized protein n=1 Tax=Brachionus plicatilis TaxID=10195 RepID=A0A3M7RSA9_BRAPC|nr:hypothetical protein BpHYR1_043534 [Brachionus plicatilis]